MSKFWKYNVISAKFLKSCVSVGTPYVSPYVVSNLSAFVINCVCNVKRIYMQKECVGMSMVSSYKDDNMAIYFIGRMKYW